MLFVFCVCCQQVMATHYRAGEILYQLVGNLTYQVQVITYTKISSPSNLADRDSVVVDWGDGTTALIPRINGSSDGSCVGASPCGVVVLTDVKKNIYQGAPHTYAGPPPPQANGSPGFFVIKFFDENRLGGIANMSQSVNVTFYVEDTIFFPGNFENIGGFSSPVLVNPAVQYAFLCDTFRTNPEAVDPDGDSLDYHLVPCKADQNHLVPAYIFPDAYCNTVSPNCVIRNTCTIDVHNGNFVWADPCAEGFYNVGVLIHKYRHGVCLGSILRDFQIIVLNLRDSVPKLQIPNDTCVRAGDPLIGRVCATDPDLTDTLTLSAVGLPFQVPVSPAVFDSIKGRPKLCQTFSWNTVCDDIQLQPYMVYFKAEDNFRATGPDGGPAPYHNQDIETWQITVIPPPVLNLTAIVNHQSIVLNWQNPYSCASSPNFRGFSVWRKVGCDPFVPSYCETGLAGTGYVKITTSNILAYTYTDNAVAPGQTYSYRVLAEFYKLPPSGIVTLQYDNQESVPSNEVCINAPVDVPVILNADVVSTDAVNGQIYTRWARPLAGGVNLDTIQDHPPYRFDLYRGQGFNYANPVLIHSSTFTSYSAIPDTDNIYTDAGINTVTGPWSYKVYFYATPNNVGATSYADTVGATPSASSIYLTIQTSDQALYLHWNYNVPWSNDSFTIYRQNHVTNNWDSIGNSYSLAYGDTGLINDTTYCYYVKGYGEYKSGNFPHPLFNRSERICTAPVDTVPPCPPILTVSNDCNLYTDQPWNTTQYVNHLLWSILQDSCSMTTVHYHIYYNASDSSNFALLDSTTSITDTTFNHILSENVSGCYAVTAVDKAGIESKLSNIVCIDNCPYYVLPNTFTPDGDGHNDYFTPFPGYRFVPKIEMKIYNRWGELVFETTDPNIHWDGKDKSGHDVSDGVYLYAGYYYEQHINGLVKKPLSGAKKGGGFIHVIRGK